MEYGRDEATKQAQKDFLKVLHFNPAYTKARISLGYNLQVILYSLILGHESTFWTRERMDLALTGDGGSVIPLVMNT